VKQILSMLNFYWQPIGEARGA